MVTFHPPGWQMPEIPPDLSNKSTRYPALPLEVKDGIEVRTYAAGYPGQRIGVGPSHVVRYRAQRLVDGVVVQSGPSQDALAKAEQDADSMAAGLHGSCRECKSPCAADSLFDPSDERPTCGYCVEWIRANVKEYKIG